MKLVTVYTTDPCARCLKAKMLLKHRGIAYQEINLAKDPDGRAELVRRTGMLTFPQVVVGEHTVGGLEDLLSADKSGLLAELTNAPA